MVHFLNKITLLMLVLTLIFNIFSISVGAVSRENFDSAEEIICVVHRGDWHSFPENSSEAVKAGGEYGFVSVDVRLTKDGKVILMADDTTDRMVVDADGKTVFGISKEFSRLSLTDTQILTHLFHIE